jgi:hypothetical protein
MFSNRKVAEEKMAVGVSELNGHRYLRRKKPPQAA